MEDRKEISTSRLEGLFDVIVVVVILVWVFFFFLVGGAGNEYTITTPIERSGNKIATIGQQDAPGPELFLSLVLSGQAKPRKYF